MPKVTDEQLYGKDIPVDSGEGPSNLQALGRGLVTGIPASAAGLLDTLSGVSQMGQRNYYTRPNPSTPPPAQTELAPAVTSFIHDKTRGAFGPESAPGSAAQLSEKAGEGVASTVPFMLGGGAPTLYGAARRAIGLALSGAAQGTAAQGAANAGFGPMGQFVASVGAGGGVQGILGGAGYVSGSLFQRFNPSQRATAAKLFVNQTVQQNNLNPAQTIAAIKAEATTPIFGKATTEQLVKDSAPGVSFQGTLEPTMRKDLLDIQQHNTQAMREYATQQFPVGHVTAAQSGGLELLNKYGINASGALKGIEGRDFGGIPMDRIDAAMTLLREEAGSSLESWLPKDVMKLIESDKFNKPGIIVDSASRTYSIPVRETTFSELNRLSSKLGSLQSQAKGPARVWLNQLRDSVEGTISDTAKATGNEDLNELRLLFKNSYRKKMAFNDPKRNPLATVIGSDPKENFTDAFKRFMTNDAQPAVALSKVKNQLSSNPKAWQGIQRLVRDHYFGEDMNRLVGEDGNLINTNVTRIRETIRKNPGLFDVAFGEGANQNANTFLDRVDQLGSGASARRGTLKMGGILPESKSNAAEDLLRGAEISTYNAHRAWIHGMRDILRRMPNNREEILKYWNEGILHPETAAVQLGGKVPRELLPVYMERARRSLATQGVVAAGLAGRQ